jgi:hypothetical protein
MGDAASSQRFINDFAKFVAPPNTCSDEENLPGVKPASCVVGSDIHMEAKFEERNEEKILKALNEKERWGKLTAGLTGRYSVSKLLDFYITSELTRLIPSIAGGPAVIVNIVTPGFCKSELMSREEGVPWALKVMAVITARTTEEGSKIIVDAAARGKESNGKYLDHQQITKYVLRQWLCLIWRELTD